MSLKVVYVYPPLRSGNWKSKLVNKVRGHNSYVNQEGFFIEALRQVSELRAYSLDKFLKTRPSCDFLVMDSKATPDGRGKDPQKNFEFLKEIKGLKKGLFVSNDRVKSMPSDEVLDIFDVVFKREPWKDLSRYNLSSHNSQKIFPTMLPCPLVPPDKLNSLAFSEHNDQQFDIFFNGQATNTKRIDVWSRLKKEPDLRIIGGLQPTWIDVTLEHRFKKLSRKRYKEIIHQSKVNLALEGIGTFTYRHLELLSQGAFMMSNSNIQKQNLPLKIVDGEHYVAYEDMDDLIEKIRYYLVRPEERLRIARNGFERFKRDYSFEKHGKCILDQLGDSLT